MDEYTYGSGIPSKVNKYEEQNVENEKKTDELMKQLRIVLSIGTSEDEKSQMRNKRKPTSLNG